MNNIDSCLYSSIKTDYDTCYAPPDVDVGGEGFGKKGDLDLDS